MREFLILVADDSPLVRKSIISTLNQIEVQNLKITVCEAEDGQDALDKIQRKKPDLILLDWHMPSMFGVEVIKTIRAAGTATPAVIVTEENKRSYVLAGIQAGASGYLLRPFEPYKLWQRIAPFILSHLPKPL